jgi:uncharacterized protein
MDKATYKRIEKEMLAHMKDGAHDGQHVYRVLYYSLDIAESYQVDLDVIITAALLHDIGREAQFKDPRLDHAIVGSEIAYKYMQEIGWNEGKANHIRNCISTHRYRKNHEPESMEAKILFDADKLDATGTAGIARTIAYKGIVAEPLYTLDQNGKILDGTTGNDPSFFQEYIFKLKNVYKAFYTERAKEIAIGRQGIARQFYESMLEEVNEIYSIGNSKLNEAINQ